MILQYTGMAAIFVMWPNSYLLIFISLFLKAFLSYLVTNGPAVSEKNKSSFSYLNDLGVRSRNDLDLEYSCGFIYLFHFLHLQIFRSRAGIVSEKYSFYFFQYKNLFNQSWPWPKIGQGHPGVIIWINYNWLESPNLHTKFHDNQPTGSWEEDF